MFKNKFLNVPYRHLKTEASGHLKSTGISRINLRKLSTRLSCNVCT